MLPLEELLEILAEKVGKDNVMRELSRLSLFAERHSRGVGYRWRRAVEKFGKGDVSALAPLIIELDIPLENFIETRFLPWTLWIPGASLIVVLGEQSIKYPNRKALEYKGVSSYDLEALRSLLSFVQERLRLRFQLHIKLMPANASNGRVEKEIKRLKRNACGGGIVFVGSPLVNPLSDRAAREILGNNTDYDRPKFAWSMGWNNEQRSYLSIRKEYKNEGIYRSDGNDRFYQISARTHDAVALDNRRFNRTGGDYKDTGMLLIRQPEPPEDPNHAQEPILIVAAGHGGLGTVAAIKGLENQHKLADELTTNDNVGLNRAFGVVQLQREKRTRKPVDDFILDEFVDIEWNFQWT